MEEVLARFPHLGDKIFQNLNSHTLIRCKEVNRSWENFIKFEKSCYLHIIQWYTNYPKSLIKKIIEKFGGSIIVLSILQEIFGSNGLLPIGWEERYMPEGQKYYTNHITKSSQWEDPRTTVSHGMHKNSQLVAQIKRIPTSHLPYGWLWDKSPEGTITYLCLAKFIQAYELPQPQLSSIPQFVNNQEEWELIWNNLTRDQKQSLLQLQLQKWTFAISQNFPKCNTELLLSFFNVELPQKEEDDDEAILNPIALYAHENFLRSTGLRISKKAFLGSTYPSRQYEVFRYRK